MSAEAFVPGLSPANGTPGSSAPSQAVQVAGSDGTNLRTLSTDSSGDLNVNVKSNVSAVNSNAQYGSSCDTNITTATTETAPANAVGFILQAWDQNTINIRYRFDGTAATTTSGHQLQPGRDSGVIMVKKNISICPESTTNSQYSLTWLMSS